MWTVPSIVRSQLVALLVWAVVALLGIALAAATRRELSRVNDERDGGGTHSTEMASNHERSSFKTQRAVMLLTSPSTRLMVRTV